MIACSAALSPSCSVVAGKRASLRHQTDGDNSNSDYYTTTNTPQCNATTACVLLGSYVCVFGVLLFLSFSVLDMCAPHAIVAWPCTASMATYAFGASAAFTLVRLCLVFYNSCDGFNGLGLCGACNVCGVRSNRVAPRRSTGSSSRARAQPSPQTQGSSHMFDALNAFNVAPFNSRLTMSSTGCLVLLGQAHVVCYTLGVAAALASGGGGAFLFVVICASVSCAPPFATVLHPLNTNYLLSIACACGVALIYMSVVLFLFGAPPPIVPLIVCVSCFAFAVWLSNRTWRDTVQVARVLVSTTACADIERRVLHGLLTRLMPAVFIHDLMHDVRTVHTAPASVLFIEVYVNGKRLSSCATAATLALLSDVFSRIEDAVDVAGAFKVETIGSEFMAVSGLPATSAQPRNSARTLLAAATAAMTTVRGTPGLEDVALHCGMASGEVVETVLGRKLLPRWKLFGDVVNTASRMKRHSAAWCILVTHNTARALYVRGDANVTPPSIKRTTRSLTSATACNTTAAPSTNGGVCMTGTSSNADTTPKVGAQTQVAPGQPATTVVSPGFETVVVRRKQVGLALDALSMRPASRRRLSSTAVAIFRSLSAVSRDGPGDVEHMPESLGEPPTFEGEPDTRLLRWLGVTVERAPPLHVKGKGEMSVFWVRIPVAVPVPASVSAQAAAVHPQPAIQDTTSMSSAPSTLPTSDCTVATVTAAAQVPSSCQEASVATQAATQSVQVPAQPQTHQQPLVLLVSNVSFRVRDAVIRTDMLPELRHVARRVSFAMRRRHSPLGMIQDDTEPRSTPTHATTAGAGTGTGTGIGTVMSHSPMCGDVADGRRLSFDTARPNSFRSTASNLSDEMVRNAARLNAETVQYEAPPPRRVGWAARFIDHVVEVAYMDSLHQTDVVIQQADHANDVIQQQSTQFCGSGATDATNASNASNASNTLLLSGAVRVCVALVTVAAFGAFLMCTVVDVGSSHSHVHIHLATQLIRVAVGVAIVTILHMKKRSRPLMNSAVQPITGNCNCATASQQMLGAVVCGSGSIKCEHERSAQIQVQVQERSRVQTFAPLFLCSSLFLLSFVEIFGVVVPVIGRVYLNLSAVLVMLAASLPVFRVMYSITVLVRWLSAMVITVAAASVALALDVTHSPPLSGYVVASVAPSVCANAVIALTVGLVAVFREREARALFAVRAATVTHKRNAMRIVDAMVPHEFTDALRSDTALSFHVTPRAVALLTTDIVGFTALAAAIGADEVVRMLDMLYYTFDNIMEYTGCYKVETIGDAYFCVAGAPIPATGDRAVCAITNAARAICAVTRAFRTPVTQRTIAVRVGVHYGTVLGAVIGNRLPRYQLFGHSVDRVQALEQSAPVNQIHASAEFVALLRQLLVTPTSSSNSQRQNSVRLSTHIVITPVEYIEAHETADAASTTCNTFILSWPEDEQ